MRTSGRTVDREIARLASRAHGVVTRQQLLGSAIAPCEITRRLRRNSLLRVYPGVYRVGHRAPSIEADYLAAVLACGDGAVLSGRAAAHLLRLLQRAPAQPEVTAPRERRIPGVRVRRARGVRDTETALWRGIPVTTVARTVVDLAGVLSPEELARACHEARIRHETIPEHVEEVLGRRPNSKGAGALRRVLRGDTRVTLSRLEARFLKRLRTGGLALPLTNTPAGGWWVDCRWPALRLTVEVDGYRYHHTRHAWEQDRRREREARARGDEFRRYTYGDVFESPDLMMAELHALLPPCKRRRRAR